VFAGQGRREEAYARVVAIAHDMKSPDQSFTSYVQECGGIEEVRRVSATTKSSSMSKEDFKKLALEGLQEVQVGVSTFDLPTWCCQTNRLKHQKHEEREFYEAIRERHFVRAESRFSLKLVRVESDLCELK
jgi:hypothetical protein